MNFQSVPKATSGLCVSKNVTATMPATLATEGQDSASLAVRQDGLATTVKQVLQSLKFTTIVVPPLPPKWCFFGRLLYLFFC